MKSDLLYKSLVTGAIMTESEWLEAWHAIRPSIKPSLVDYFANLVPISRLEEKPEPTLIDETQKHLNIDFNPHANAYIDDK